MEHQIRITRCVRPLWRHTADRGLAGSTGQAHPLDRAPSRFGEIGFLRCRPARRRRHASAAKSVVRDIVLSAINERTGAVVWRDTLPEQVFPNSLIAANGTLCLSRRLGAGGGTRSTSPTARGNGLSTPTTPTRSRWRGASWCLTGTDADSCALSAPTGTLIWQRSQYCSGGGQGLASYLGSMPLLARPMRDSTPGPDCRPVMATSSRRRRSSSQPSAAPPDAATAATTRRSAGCTTEARAPSSYLPPVPCRSLSLSLCCLPVFGVRNQAGWQAA